MKDDLLDLQTQWIEGRIMNLKLCIGLFNYVFYDFS